MDIKNKISKVADVDLIYASFIRHLISALITFASTFSLLIAISIENAIETGTLEANLSVAALYGVFVASARAFLKVIKEFTAWLVVHLRQKNKDLLDK